MRVVAEVCCGLCWGELLWEGTRGVLKGGRGLLLMLGGLFFCWCSC